MGARGWLWQDAEPAQGAERPVQRGTGETGATAIASLELTEVGQDFMGPPTPVPMEDEQVRSYLTKQIGYRIVGRPWILLVLGSLCVALLGCGIMLNRRRKQEVTAAQRQRAINPFLPYDEDLYVADLSPTHVCLFNKFNVFEHHLLIVTRQFVDQETPLDRTDFEALAVAMAEIDGLGTLVDRDLSSFGRPVFQLAIWAVTRPELESGSGTVR